MCKLVLLAAFCCGAFATDAENIATNAAALVQAKADVSEVRDVLGYLWLLVCGGLVMFMQAGFAMLESGTCRSKHAGLVLMKNVLDACIGSIVWFFLGYGLAYGVGDSPNEVIGTSQFAGDGFEAAPVHYRDWFFQWAFCVTGATIVSGAIAERTHFIAYCLYSIIMTGIIYPVIVYWCWSGEGYLTVQGYSDFAGSGVVHLTGGIAALVGAALVGPRIGRWEGSESHRFHPHNMGSVVLGTFILWFGWYGFNCGSTLAFDSLATAQQASLVAMNTTLSAASGGIMVFVLRLRNKHYDLAGCCNGIIAGLVVICAGVGDMYPSVAILSGLLGGLAMEGGHVLVLKLHIDDPIDAFAVHGCAGMMGVITRPLFDKEGVDGEMFGAHILALVCICAWSGGWTAIVFGILKLLGKLRVSVEEEESGSNVELATPDMYRLTTPRSPDNKGDAVLAGEVIGPETKST